MPVACGDKRPDIFGKTRAAVATAGIQEFATNASIAAYALTNHVDIGASEFTKRGDLVHERDSGRQHRISRIFSHFGRRNIHKQHSEIVEQERPVKTLHHLTGALRLNADHHPVGRHEILDRSTLFEKFGV